MCRCWRTARRERADHRRRGWRRAAPRAAASRRAARGDGGDRRRGDPAVAQFLPGIAGDAWDDPRAEVIVGDGIDYVKRAADASFDAIIVDFTDPIGVGEVLFTDAFYANCARILTARGLVVNQCGVPFMQAAELRETSARRAKFFPHVTAYVAAVPTYVGGFMTLGWAAKDAGADAGSGGGDPTPGRGGGHPGDHAVLDAGNPRRGVQPAAVYRTGASAGVI